MTQYKLLYFDGKGLAETSRMLFKIANVDFEDFRYPLEIIDLATFNMVRDEFDKDKKEGKLTLSMNKLPALEIVKSNIITTLFQSRAIERYLASEFDLMGKTPLEKVMIDALCETIRDLKSDYQAFRKAENKEESFKKWFNEVLPEKLKLLEVILQEYSFSDYPFAVGSNLSLADIVIHNFVVDFFDNKEGIKNATKDCKKLSIIVENVSKHPEIIKWKETRPDTKL
jgi:glutathione S-transferase